MTHRPGRWHRARRSLRWRLVALFLLLAVAITVSVLGTMQQWLRGGWQGYVRPLVANYIDQLAREIGTPPDVAKAQALVARLPLAIRIEGPQVQWDSQPGSRTAHRWRWRDRSTGDDADDDRPGERSGWWQTRLLADGHRITFGLADPPDEMRSHLAGWGLLALLLAFTAMAFGAVRHLLLRPLEDIRSGAQRYARGEFGQPIVPRRADELGELAGQINAMARSLHGMLDAKRALLLAISHELRSPLTRARVNAELLPEGAAQEALVRDLGEMRDLIVDLLESERLATGHAVLQTEPCDLQALLREVIDSHFAGRVDVPLAATVPLLPLDPARMRLLLRNLIDNALRHSAGAAPPTVRVAADAHTVTLGVRDFGPGVAPEHLAQLTEPFYRADSARQRSTGGVGLGLYLCRLVAQAHGGTIELRNAGPGLEALVRLPLSRSP
jgi:signal transduction histidine kinase